MPYVIRSIFFLAAGCVLILECAHRGAPSGGPVDKVPPQITSTSPENGSVNVKTGKKIVFNFSEWIEPGQAEKSISVYPSLEKGIEVEAYGKKATVVSAGGFRDSTTYHVEIDNRMKDIHGNPLSNPYHLVFSTGPFLDSGRINGCVISDKKPALRPNVAIYDLSRSGPPDSLLFLEPDYITQVDSQLNFNFNNIRMAEYLCVAFEDPDGDKRLSPLREKCYSSTERRVNAGEEPGEYVLYPVDCDTSSLSVASITAHSGRYIFCELSRSLPFAVNPQELLKTGFYSKDSTVSDPEIDTVYMKTRASRFIVKFSEPLSWAGYECVYQKALYNPASTDTVIFDTVVFNADASRDTINPVLENILFSGRNTLTPSIDFVWSEPVRPSDGCSMFLADSTDTVDLTASDDCFGDTTRILPARHLLPGKKYAGHVPLDCFEDLYGNGVRSMSDTVEKDIGFSITTVNQDSMCISLSGGAPCLEQDSNRTWFFLPFNKNERFTDISSDNEFMFDSIPAGKGRIGYFSDRDKDGKITAGSLFPWYQPEPWYIFPDSIEARARWEIEGVNFESCRKCSR